MDSLKLESQLCFPLYAASKEVVKKYTPLLEEIGLTYTQYISMIVLWDKKQITAKALGECLFLDSGTITPVIKRLEQQGLVTRQRSLEDERSLIITLTQSGELLKERAKNIPQKIGSCLKLDRDEAMMLYQLLYKVLGKEPI